MGNDRYDMEKWMDMWTKAQEMDAFKPSQPQIPVQKEDVPSNPKVIQECDTKYWNMVYQRSKHPGQVPDVLEAATDFSKSNDKLKCPCDVTKPDNKTVAQITDDLGKLANPVHASTRGPDNKLRVTPNWAFGPELVDLHNMKIKLQQLEDKMAADPMLEDKKSKGIIGQIDDLKKKIDELSDNINPSFRDEYLS